MGASTAARFDALHRAPHALAISLITVAGAALRFGTLDVQSFGLVETFTAWLSEKDLDSMFSAMSETEGTPPVYYIVAWLWAHIFGSGEIGLRSLSALLGTATIPLAAVVGTKLAGPRAGVVTAVLVAANPLLFWSSQEARAYALLVLLATASVIALLRARERPSTGRLAAWAAIATLILGTHYFGGFLVATEAIVLLVSIRKRAAVLACLAPALTAVALTPLLITQKQEGEELPGSTLRRIGVVAKQLMTGPNIPADWWIAGIVAVCVLLALLAYRDPARRTAAKVPAVVAGGAAIPLAILALAGTDLLAARYLLPALVPTLLVLSIGFAASRATVIALVVVTGASLTAIALVQVNDRYQRVNYRGAAEALGPPKSSRAVVYAPKARMQVYLEDARPMPKSGAPVSAVDVVSLTYTDRGHVTPPRGPSEPPPDGFRLVDRQETSTFTLVRYEATEERLLRPSDLEPLDLTPDDFPTVLLQGPE
jgi:mannosyltransferase